MYKEDFQSSRSDYPLKVIVVNWTFLEDVSVFSFFNPALQMLLLSHFSDFVVSGLYMRRFPEMLSQQTLDNPPSPQSVCEGARGGYRTLESDSASSLR